MSINKSSSAVAEPSPADSARRAGLLEASLAVFARFGFRKTSMDEVARAAQISRQGLYLHFANKEELFKATVDHACASSLADALKALDADGPLPARLVESFDQWVGRYVGQFGADAADVMEAAENLAGTLIEDHEKKFLDAIAAALREGGLAAAYKPAGVTARQLAEHLGTVAGGLKHRSDTREEFREGMVLAVRIACAPLPGSR
jgi:AcrR family transcriptional regulator